MTSYNPSSYDSIIENDNPKEETSLDPLAGTGLTNFILYPKGLKLTKLVEMIVALKASRKFSYSFFNFSMSKSVFIVKNRERPIPMPITDKPQRNPRITLWKK